MLNIVNEVPRLYVFFTPLGASPWPLPKDAYFACITENNKANFVGLCIQGSGTITSLQSAENVRHTPVFLMKVTEGYTYHLFSKIRTWTDLPNQNYSLLYSRFIIFWKFIKDLLMDLWRDNDFVTPKTTRLWRRYVGQNPLRAGRYSSQWRT